VDLHEQLFDLSMEIAAAPGVEAACQEALTILRGLIPAESGAALYAGVNDTELRFVSAFGPAAARVRGLRIPVDAGLAGFCHGTGLALLVQDVARDKRHDPSVDQKVGYHTRSVLAVSIRDVEGTSYGCVELINAPARFSDWQLEAGQVIGRTLGDFVAARQ